MRQKIEALLKYIFFYFRNLSNASKTLPAIREKSHVELYSLHKLSILLLMPNYCILQKNIAFPMANAVLNHEYYYFPAVTFKLFVAKRFKCLTHVFMTTYRNL